MSTGGADPASVRRLIRLAGAAPGAAVSDRELVDRFVRDRSEAAFADLMARHGPMVLAVCRRYLRDPHSADDAFQATFIVLARRAGAVRWRESIGGWLFEVATRVARRALAQALRRSTREGGSAAAVEPVTPAPTDPADLAALQNALDEELRHLPEKLRTPVVLCHLEGLSQDEVARHLGISDGQLRGRLYRAKERLRERLLRRGFALSAVLLALTVGPTAEGVPPALAALALRLVTARDPIPTAVHYLALGVIRDMTTTLKAVAVLALVGALGLAAAGFAVRSAQADPPQPLPSPPAPRAGAQPATPPDHGGTPGPVRRTGEKDEKKGEPDRVWCTIKSVDAKKNVLRVQPQLPPGSPPAGGIFPDADVDLDAKTELEFAGKPIKVADLRPGMRALLLYPADPNLDPFAPNNLSKPLAVRAEWPRQSVVISATDRAKNTVTFLVEGEGGVGLPVTLDVVKDAVIVVDGFPGELEDLPLGPKVGLELSLDKKSAAAIDTGPVADFLPGTVKKFDPVALTLLVQLDANSDNGKRPVTLALPVSADAKVRMIKRYELGARLADAKPSDLAPRMRVRLKLSADRKKVIGILASPSLFDPI
jgi:RNA polymerase sigma factor (sigma-70 family)